MEIITVTDPMMGENCYLLIEEKQVVIIDPGLDYEKIKDELDIRKLKVKYILLTHGHYDHTYSLKYFKDIPIYAHEKEKILLEDPEKNLSSYTDELLSAKDITYYRGQRVVMDEFEFVHSPGHTDGSVLIISGNNVFTGDTLFYDSIGRTDMPSGDPKKMKESLKLFSNINDNSMIYPGHGNCFKLADAYKINFFLKRQ
jgi:glyoxylase-like metal-dependent hydrolase (beta-lactamase superfamily II)